MNAAIVGRSAAQTAAWDASLADPDVAPLCELVDALVADRAAPADDLDPAVDTCRGLLVAQGLWSVGMPEAVGGGDAPLPLLMLTLARLARGWPALALACAHAHAAVTVLATEPAWTSHAEQIAGGAPVAVVDALAPNARLVVEAQPDCVALSGTVARVDVADGAPMLLVVNAGARGHSVLVAADVLGVTHGRFLARSGLAGARTHDVRIDQVVLTQRHRRVAGDTDPVPILQLLVAAIACGVATGAVAAASDYVVGREQFGAPLAALPTVARSVLDARADVAAAFDRTLTLGAATDPVGALAAASALRPAFTAAIGAATAAIQLHGGYGYLQEYPVERALRDLVSLRAAAAVGPVIDSAAAAMFRAG